MPHPIAAVSIEATASARREQAAVAQDQHVESSAQRHTRRLAEHSPIIDQEPAELIEPTA
jgi:hypothetical protein